MGVDKWKKVIAYLNKVKADPDKVYRLLETAYSKGLKEKTVIMRHAFRNSLIPVVTSIGPELFLLIGGSVIIEQIFSLPGIGRLTLQAIQTRDYPVISGVLLIFSIALILINLLIVAF